MSSRGKNFTERERCKLMELVQKYKHIIENKCTNAVYTLKKNEAREAIMNEFNSTAEVPRTTKQLTTAYLNMKRTTRQNIANENIQKYLEQNTMSTEMEGSIIHNQVVEVQELIKQLKKDEVTDKDEPASSGDSGDESGSEPESPSEKLMQVHKQEWLQNEHNDRETIKIEVPADPLASTSAITQEADSSKNAKSLPKLLPKMMDLPGGAMLYHSGVLAGVGLDGIGSNIGVGNLAMGYPHSFILGLANQAQDGASSSTQPQFITIPLSMAMAAAAGAPSATVTNGCPSASSDDSSELQDLSTGRK